MLTAVLAVAGMALIFGLLLGYANIHFHVEEDPKSERVAAVLPQTQCGQCGFAGCKPYAEAVAKGEAAINLCPPGGTETMLEIAGVLGVEPVEMNAETAEPKPPGIAVIDEALCIGCTLCIQACPVDAILGAAKQMHTVIASECTGCEKCLEPCPVDCIRIDPLTPTIQTWVWPFPRGGAPSEIAANREPYSAFDQDQAA